MNHDLLASIANSLVNKLTEGAIDESSPMLNRAYEYLQAAFELGTAQNEIELKKIQNEYLTGLRKN